MNPFASGGGLPAKAKCRVVALATGGWIALLAGCTGQPAVTVSDPEAAVKLVDESFQVWKAGRSPDELRQRVPPVYVAEDLWRQGFQLTDYSIDGSGEMFGTNVRVRVTLKGNGLRGEPINRQMKYLVTTTPAMTIAREDR